MYQQIVIVGNLGRDPEMRYMPNGTPVTSLNVATNRKYNNSDGQKIEETTWFRVSVFGKQAEVVAQYLKKGSSCLVEGRLNPDRQTGGPRIFKRQDGSSGASFEVTANVVRFLGGRSDADYAPPSNAEESVPAAQEDEIPF